jgi:C4-dicarboxylate-specific signal transduction histidine kinase
MVQFEDLFHACQEISSEINMNSLAQKCLKIVMERTGCGKGGLILIKEDNPQLIAFGDANGIKNAPFPLLENGPVPNGLIQNVLMTRRAVLVDVSSDFESWGADIYFQQNHPSSAYCVPIFSQARLVAILYLESLSDKAFFSVKRIAIIDILGSQIGISIENANLYAELEKRVDERTRELLDAQHFLLYTEKMSALGEMSAGIAHEVNNPMAILGLGCMKINRLLQMKNLDQMGFGDTIKRMEISSQRIFNIMKGLRLFSTEGEIEAFKAASVRTIIDDAVGFCAEGIKENKITLKTTIQKEDLLVECLEDEISQLIINLINNSIDAVSNLEDRWIKIDVIDLGKEVEFRVVDSGKGITSKIIEKVMQPFFTTKEIGKGTGLGLSISRGIAEKHGGHLVIDNDYQNTCFKFSIPKSQKRSM